SESFNIAKKAAGLTFILSPMPAYAFGEGLLFSAVHAPADSTAPITFATGTGSVGCSVTSAGLVTITGAATGTDKCIIEASTAARSEERRVGTKSRSLSLAKKAEGRTYSLSTHPGKSLGEG